MRRFRLDPAENEESTWAGCLLALATGAVALVFTVWVAPLYAGPLLSRLDENSLDVVKLVIGVILYSPTVLVGLAFYAAVGALLEAVGIRLWRARREERRVRREKRGEPDWRTVGERVLGETPDRLVVRSGRGEHVVGILVCLVCGPVFGLLACALVVGEIREPGALGGDLLRETLRFLPLDTEGWLFAILARGSSFVMVLVFSLFSVFCCHELYRDVVHGGRRWVFDRSRELLTYGDKPMCSLKSIAQVVLTQGRLNLNEVYWVSLAPERDESHAEQETRDEGKRNGTREVRFSFGRQADAEEFARTVASFLHAEVVNKLA